MEDFDKDLGHQIANYTYKYMFFNNIMTHSLYLAHSQCICSCKIASKQTLVSLSSIFMKELRALSSTSIKKTKNNKNMQC